MKRRNADCGKIRRPIKRNKIAESMHSNTFLYMKFLILWAIVIIADFMLEFRFEFLWPFWLLLRSVHDSFKYKGLAFSVLFVCIAITSDLICLFFIPVHWLFFAASTYVWVQYVWHTDKGICLPTIILWMLFVYLEAAIRWKDSRHMPHLDLCRPFAAHCIGYPVVSLGFGFKSYVGHLMRIRKQREVAKENEFYMQLLQQALPQQPADEQTVCLPDDETTATLSSSTANGIQTLNGDISCGGSGSANVTNSSSSSSLVSGLGALTGELIKDLIATTTSLTQHFSERAFNRSGTNNAQTTTNSSSSNNKVLSLGGNSNSASNNSTSSNGHAVTVQNGTAGSGASGTQHSHQMQQANSSNGSSSNSSGAQSKDRAGQCSTTSSGAAATTTVGNGGIRKQAHNGTTSEKEAGNKCDFNSTKSSYHQQQQQASGNGSATAMLSAALMLSTAGGAAAVGVQSGSNGVEKPVTTSSGNNSKDYAAMNGGSSSSGAKGAGAGNEYHQQNHHQSTKENHRLASSSSSSTYNQSSSGGTGGVHYAHMEKSTSGDSTNHITSASSSPPSMSTSSLEPAAAGGGKRVNGQPESVTESHTGVANGGGGGGGTEKTKGKKNRSRQKQEEDRQLSLMQICTSCSRLEHEVKRLKSDVSHIKQIENELKQRTDTNANLKSNLQAKNKESEELEKKLQDLASVKQSDRQMLNSLEQRLGYEQRQRKQLETALTNERKLRIKSEEKAAKCYTEIASMDEKKKSAELQNRSYEVEMRKMENELRNRDSEEVLMSALQSMQQKNMSLEESLSRETRFKLDLFSALGEARRQIELKDGLIGKQMDEITDLKAKIAQLVAIMPIMPISPARPDSGVGVGYHHVSPTVPVVSSSVSMLRLSNGSPLMVNSSQDLNNNANERSMKMLGQSPQSQMFIQQQQQQLHQMSQQQQASSNLDPNARAYTPVNTNSD